MILIAESGSTKTDWTLLDNTIVVQKFKTIGFNPYYHSQDDIEKGIDENADLTGIANEVTHVHFFGAGCSTESNNLIVQTALGKVFDQAKIEVGHDLLAAALATYSGTPGVVGILGTGSNCCFFDGTDLHQFSPSLGYIMGDEGGGGFFGKKLVKEYCYGNLPEQVIKEFDEKVQKSVSELIWRVNSEPHANVFLASLMPIIANHKGDPFIDNLLNEGMNEFVIRHVLPIPNAKELPIHFVGSVAHHFKEYLENATLENGLQLGTIIQSPSDHLVAYFQKYVLGN